MANGVISRKSPHSVKETADRFVALLQAKGITVFARIDQQAEARKVGLDLPPTELVIFGNPKAGTPVMAAYPLAALDLPLKLVVYESVGGKIDGVASTEQGVWMVYNDPGYLRDRYGLPEEMAGKLNFGPLVDHVIGG